jgi:hypothetical protein
MENRGTLHWIKELFEKRYQLRFDSPINENEYITEYFNFEHGLALRIHKTKRVLLISGDHDFEKPILNYGGYDKFTLLLVFPFLPEDDHVKMVNNLKKTSGYGKVILFDLPELLDEAEKLKVDYRKHLENFPFQDDLKILNSGDKSDYFQLKSYLNKEENNPPPSRKRKAKDIDDKPNAQKKRREKKTTRDTSEPVTISKELLAYNYYFAQIPWGTNRSLLDRFIYENIWETETGFSKYANLVQEGNVLLGIIPVFNNKAKSSQFRVLLLGYVYKNEENSKKLGVIWKRIATSPFLAKEIADNTNLSLGEISKHNLIPLLQKLSPELDSPLEKIIAELKERANKLLEQENVKKETENKSESEEVEDVDEELQENITRLAGIQSDSDDGTDYLGIEEDVTAFARVMSAKSFNPPLAIGLLGKWGSGKSFFMRKLQERIQELSSSPDQEMYCKGIAHVHFNVWSYMDSNLWASIVTKIFEGLNLYIKNEEIDDEEKRLIQEEIAKKLSMTNQEVYALEIEKEKAHDKVKALKQKKNGISTNLKKRINQIKNGSLSDVLKTVDESFQVTHKIEAALKENESFVKTSDQLKSIVPEEYWKNPDDLYNRFQSKRFSNLFRQFFSKETWKRNWIWLLITLLILGVPTVLQLLSVKIGSINFTLPHTLGVAMSFVGTAVVGIRKSFKQLSPIVAALWKIKQDYTQQKEAAIFQFQQEEKALQIEIKNYQVQIENINDRIEQSEEIAKNLEFRITKTLSTETLFQFIEKRASSEDYKKHLGIVSIIRKDFEILSNLFKGSIEEQGEDAINLNDRFQNPLDRIVLYIDDLDRCDEQRVVEVLEAVNLLMAFPLFIVVVGVDPRWVKNALNKKYKLQFTNKEEEELKISPSNYLEKIFQIPFHLKSAEDKAVKSMLRALAEARQKEIPIEEVSNTSADKFETQLVLTEEEPKLNVSVTPETTVNSNTPESIPIENRVLPKPPKIVNERIELLKFADNELDFIESMSVVLGNNPRAIKRFVNIYRVIKAHEVFKYSSETADEEILAVLFMIALPLGNFKQLVGSFKQYVLGNENTTLATYFESSVTEYDSLKDQLYEKLKPNYQNLLGIDRDTFLHQYHFIKRFSF